MIHVRATAPTRIDLAGGTLDLWPIHTLLDAKATVNVGITLPAATEITTSADRHYHLSSEDQTSSLSGDFATVSDSGKLPLISMLLKAIWRPELPAIRIVTSAKSPAGAGLGGSSCLGITIAAALMRARSVVDSTFKVPDESELVRTVQDVEARLIHAPTGCQDYWGGVRGRVNILRYPPGRIEVTTLDPHKIRGLQAEMIPCYSGKSRASAINNWEIFKRLFDGDKSLLGTFNEIGAAAEECARAVETGDLEALIASSKKEWELRTKLWPAIESPETKKLNDAAIKAGARFSRVCGAGGGGVMAVFAPPSRRESVVSALQQAGGTVLDAVIADTGLSVS